MPEATDWNTKTINEFRANEGRVGGPFEGAPMVLVTHRGRKSGHQHVTPMMYLPDETDDSVIYVFATKGGAPSNPDWYYNLTTVGEGSIERGTDSYPVTVREVTGDERDRVYAEQARRYPGFADYAKQTEGIRTIPVLAHPDLAASRWRRAHTRRAASPYEAERCRLSRWLRSQAVRWRSVAATSSGAVPRWRPPRCFRRGNRAGAGDRQDRADRARSQARTTWRGLTP